MKRIVAAIGLSLLLSGGVTVFAFRAPARHSVSQYDKRWADHPKSPELAADKQPAADHLRELIPSAQLRIDRVKHAPNFVADPNGFLTGPKGIGKGVSARTAQEVPATDPHHPVKAFLKEHAALFGHGPEVLATARLSRDYKTAHNGMQTTIWQQHVDEIDVFEGLLMANVTAQGELVSISSGFIGDPEKAADAGLPNRKAKQQKPLISAKEALSLASKAIDQETTPESFTELDATTTGADQRQRFHAPGQFNESRVQLVWLPTSDSQMRLCWLVRLVSQSLGEGFHILIDADSGELMIRRPITIYLSNATYNVYTSDSPSPFTPGLQAPGAFQPALLPRTLVTTSALNTNASPLGWINDGDNETRGNNVDAHLDRNRDDLPDLPRPAGSPSRVFDFPLNLNQDPTTYGNAAVVSLFYWCNWMHDQLYDLGFTEQAGNLQNNNFGRGGKGNDAMQADSQDGSGFNNANLTPDFDGFPCRIQMYVFDFPTPQRDGDLDTEVMLHEYTHALSSRLVGGGVLINELQSAGMGEGWSDFYAMSLLSEPTDDVDAAYPMGGYVTYQLGFMNQNYYFGIRRYPYCTDMGKNPLTFKDIDPSQASAHPGVPLSPLDSPFSPLDADEVHNQGEVWCVTLWEARANLIKKYGFAVGNKLMLQLVTDGMKLSPADPNFLQARDAIIRADVVDNAGANYNELWAAFAKRGLGGSASSPSSSTTAGVVEAFDVPGLALKTVTIRDTLTGNGNKAVDVNECVELFITLFNNGRRAANNIAATLSSLTPGVSVSQPESAYPLIPVTLTASNLVPFRIFVSTNFLCGSQIDLNLTIRSDQDTRTVKVRLNTGSVGTPNSYFSTQPVPIPDGDPRGIDSAITVTDFPGALGKVTVSLFVNHTWDDDLTFQLVAPDGTRILLTSHEGFTGDNYGISCSPESSRTTFDDDASRSIASGQPPFLGSYRPLQQLSSLNGRSGFAVNGVWRLHAVDEFLADVGVIQCWTLNLHANTCTPAGGECATDLSVSATTSPNPPSVGSNLTYSVIATNRGPIPATGVYLTNFISPGLDFLSLTSTRGSCTQSNGVVVCNIGTLPVNSAATLTIQTHPTVLGYVTNVAVLTSPVADLNRLNNTNVFVSLIPAPTPAIVAGGSHLVAEDGIPANGGIDPGETVAIDFSLRNIGTGAASNLVATLLSGPGIAPINADQVYGYVPINATAARTFSFKATGTNGQTITPILSLRDGTNNLGTVSFAFGLHSSYGFVNGNVINISSGQSGPAALYPSTIFVSGVPGVVGRVTATISNLSHTFPSDLDILLVSPNGHGVLLMSDVGGGNPVSSVTLTFDDSGAPLPISDVIRTGRYHPTDNDAGDGDAFPLPAPPAPYDGALSGFSGLGANGTWSLFVYDDTAGDGGRIAGGWQLTIETIDPVDSTADLVLIGTASPNPVTASSNVVYNVSVVNQGPDSATDVVLTSQLPAGAIFVSADSPAGDCSVLGSTVTCHLGDIGKQGQVDLSITASPTRSGTATNLITVAANELDPNHVNSTLALRTTVNAATDVAVSISGIPNPAIANQILTLTVLATNLGPNTATGVFVTNRLPAGATFNSATPSVGTVNNSSGLLVWNIGSLAPAQVASLLAQVRPVAGTAITNSAQIKATQPQDLNLSNNTSNLVLTVSDGPVIIRPGGAVLLSEGFAPPSNGIDPNEIVTVSLGLRNIGISNSTALIATLSTNAGVIPVTTIQDYGVIPAFGGAVARPFTFRSAGNAGDTISANLTLVDGSTTIGQVSFPFVLGGSRQFGNPGLILVQDNTTANPYPSTINVSGLGGVIARVSVTLSNLSHTFPDDLDILLVAPNGQSVMLMSDAGGPLTNATPVTLTFSDSASNNLPDSDKLISGLFRPTDYQPADFMPAPAPPPPYSTDLSLLNGGSPNGAWSLFVFDDEISDAGQILGWGLNLTTVGHLPIPPRISLVRIVNDRPQFTITGQAGDRLVIEGSNDLVNWATISNTVLGADSTVFTDNSISSNIRFYRVGRQP